jgi:hypothetical protein
LIDIKESGQISISERERGGGEKRERNKTVRNTQRMNERIYIYIYIYLLNNTCDNIVTYLLVEVYELRVSTKYLPFIRPQFDLNNV